MYAGLGVVLLGAVLVLAQTSYGAKLSLMGIQPSEVIKLTFVFFMASLLAREVTFKKLCWLLLWQVSMWESWCFQEILEAL